MKLHKKKKKSTIIRDTSHLNYSPYFRADQGNIWKQRQLKVKLRPMTEPKVQFAVYIGANRTNFVQSFNIRRDIGWWHISSSEADRQVKSHGEY